MCFVLIGPHRHCVERICNANPKTNVHKLHIHSLQSFLSLYFALEFAVCSNRILQINYVDVDVDAPR